MWTRAELKQKAKFSFKRNYWKTILVSFLFAFLIGGASSGVSSGFTSGFTNGLSSGYTNNVNSGSYSYDTDGDYEGYENYYESEDGDVVELFEESYDEEGAAGVVAVFLVLGIVFAVVFVVVFVIILVLDALLLNPLEVGARRFFYLNLNQQAEVKELAYAFDHSYKNVMKVMFVRDIYIMLWSLLLFIPGIIKSYEYKMIPYLLTENPDMSMKEAFELSKRMMYGEKWKAFVLDLSFLGWILLCLVPFVGFFYVDSYIFMTDAALYEKLKYAKGINVYGNNPYQPMYGVNPNQQNPYYNNSNSNMPI